MRLAHVSRIAAVTLLLGLTGCVRHYHYYGTGAAAAAGPICVDEAPAVSYGEVCDVPTRVSNGKVLTGSRALSDEETPRVVVSEPSRRSSSSRRYRSNGLAWRKQEPSLARTTVNGALDDESLAR